MPHPAFVCHCAPAGASRVGLRTALALALVWTAAALVAAGAQEGPLAGLPSTAKGLQDLADSLRLAGRADSSVTLARAFQLQAMERGDTAATVVGHLVECRMHTFKGRAAQAEACARAALRLSRASGDSAHARESLLEVANTVDAQGRTAEAVPMYEQVAALSQSAGDQACYARARMNLGRVANAQGRFQDAHRDLTFARAVFDSLKLTRDELNATNGLGIALFSLMDLEGSAECFRHCAELGHTLGNPAIEGRGINNLARVLYAQGDQASAEQYAERAVEIQRATGDVRSLTIAMLNVGEARARLGRYSEAVQVIEEARALAQEHELHSTVCSALENLGFTRWLEGRTAESAACYREALAQAHQQDLPNEEVNALLGIARALSSQDSVAAAYQLLATRTSPLRGRIEPTWELQLDDHLASFLTTLGRHREAIPLHQDVERRAIQGGLINFQVMTLSNLAESFGAIGEVDSALAALQRGERVWESQRSLPVDPRWREERGSAGRRLYERIATLLLTQPASMPEADRARRAFDALQPFKARTLLERMLGPGVEPAGRPPVTLAELQRDILDDGELLLDVYAGSKETVLFAVTKTACRAHRIPEAQEHLNDKLDVLRGLMSASAVTAPGRDPQAVEQACRAVGRVLLQPVEDLVAASSRVVFAADGPLNLVAAAALVAPAPQGAHPLVADKELVRVPSATVLAHLRRPERAAPGTEVNPGAAHKATTVLALAGESDGVMRLPAAVDEVRGLGRRYRGVQVRIGDDAEATLREPKSLSSYDVLHLAAHADVDDENPWRSGIVLAAASGQLREGARAGSTASSTDESSVRGGNGSGSGLAALRAASIAGLPLTAHLAVLSACNSAGGRVVSGEGVLGLTGAFLAAGVPTVVATLWPVDDRTTARLMEQFYRRLAAGESAAAALRSAQLALRADAATSDPFYWAGFVVVGEGNTRLELQRRAPAWTVVVTILALGVLIVLVARSVRRGS